jgi:hypothetical protein
VIPRDKASPLLVHLRLDMTLSRTKLLLRVVKTCCGWLLSHLPLMPQSQVSLQPSKCMK